MCGIAGVCNLNGQAVPLRLLQRMTDSIAHRGPDSDGHYTDGPVGLGNRRLAIIDPSPAGHQPMSNEDGAIVVTFNGAIYNFERLRVELEARGHRFHSRADTEVIVHAYEEYGPDCVEHFNGMFAFALWDSKRQRLLLARDRYGVKPLYWFFRGGALVFSSEIKAILEHPSVTRDVSYEALDEYFTFQNIFSDRTLFAGIRLLPPASLLYVDVAGRSEPVVHTYWDYADVVGTVEATEEEAADRLAHLFSQAVSRQLVADVPIGAYLSGGLDSGSIVSVARQHLPRMTTFTGGFDLSSAQGLEVAFDERLAAEELANLLKTEHYEVVMHAGDMEWVLPELIWHVEDLRVGQCYPNYYVARLAGKFVKVVLSGTGGDELFGGYPWRYYTGAQSSGREDYFGRYYEYWQRLLSDDEKARLFNERTRHSVGDHSTYDVFRGVFSRWDRPFETPSDYVNASLYLELKTFLHGLLLIEDRVSMAHGLETRVPFLDNDVVEFALQLPAHHKLHDLAGALRIDENRPGKRLAYSVEASDAGKAVLRRAMRQLLPSGGAARTKQGFSAPDASWFRGESIDYINRLLRDRRAMVNEFFDPAEIGRLLDEHTSGRRNRRLLIWSLLSFEWWCRSFLDSDGGTPAAELRAHSAVSDGRR
jgi:asparagine synthase (glutamine-hydrolysing)